MPSADGDIILFSLHFSGCHELIDNGQGSSKKKNEFSSPFFSRLDYKALSGLHVFSISLTCPAFLITAKRTSGKQLIR